MVTCHFGGCFMLKGGVMQFTISQCTCVHDSVDESPKTKFVKCFPCTNSNKT